MPLLRSLCAFALMLGQNGRDPNELLERARVKLQALTRRLANYTCIETVDRQYFQAPANPRPTAENAARTCHVAAVNATDDGRRLESTDRIRFEVTVAGSGEILSRLGASRFDPRDLDALVRFGPIGTGSFGSYLIGVFDNPKAVFRYVGEQSLEHRMMFEYQYQVPVEGSRYRVRSGTASGATWVPMAYRGTFWIDPDSLDLERFTILSDDLPAPTGICNAESTLDYSGVRIRVGDALLPRQSELRITMLDGREAVNTTNFSGCKEYQAESALVFDETPEADSAAVRPMFRPGPALPIGLPVTLAFSAAIDSVTAAAGDLVSAEVVRSVRRPSTDELLIPAGPRPYFLFSMSFNRMEVNGAPSLFAARFEPSVELAEELGIERSANYLNSGTLLFASKNARYLLPAGYQSTWSTLATPGR